MPNDLIGVALRWRPLIALAIGLALLADLTIFGVAGYARLARSHVRMSIAVEHEIVQVFVNCRLAHSAYIDSPEATKLDLGWLDTGNIVTVQVRGRKAPGFYRVLLDKGAGSKVLVSAGSYGRPLVMESGQIIAARSFTANGHQLGSLSCQPGPFRELPLAQATAGTPGRWASGRIDSLIGVASRLSSVIPWLLAFTGLGVLTGLVILSRVDRLPAGGSRIAVGVVAAAADVLLAIVWAFAAPDFNAVFVLCVAAGVASLIAALVWLLSLSDDLPGARTAH